MNGHCHYYCYHLFAVFLQWQTLILVTFSSSTETKVELTTPVNPVKEGGLLSIHCQAWGLRSDHHLTILRQIQGEQGNKIEVLSVNKGVLDGVDERVFLAERQLNDGSTVYFLSITHVTRHDEGQYVCKIEKLGITNTVIGEPATANVTVMYFPAMTPICTYRSALEVPSGTQVTLNCTAELSNPAVTIKWIYGATKKVIDTKQIMGNGVTYSELNVTLTARDTNVFLCQISSPIFPDEHESCHIGPFNVIPGPDEDWPIPVTDTLPPRKDNIPGKDIKPNRKPTGKTLDKIKCSKVCSVDASKQFPWIIAFVAAVVLTILFLVIGILLYVSYIRANKEHSVTATSLSRRRHPDDIYSELDIKPMDTKVYMPLEFRDKLVPDRQSIHYSDIPKM